MRPPLDDMLKLILEALDHLAKRLSEKDETVSVEEVRIVLEDCQQAIQELDLLLDNCRILAASDKQPGPSTKPLLAPLRSHGGEDWETECKDIETFRFLLHIRVKTLLSLSRYGSFHPATQVTVGAMSTLFGDVYRLQRSLLRLSIVS